MGGIHIRLGLAGLALSLAAQIPSSFADNMMPPLPGYPPQAVQPAVTPPVSYRHSPQVFYPASQYPPAPSRIYQQAPQVFQPVSLPPGSTILPSIPMQSDMNHPLRQKIVEIARTQLWVDKGINRNYVNFAFSTGKDQAWCADFVSTILKWSVGSPWGHESLANNIYLWGRNNNQLSPMPSPGDIVLFRYGQGDVSHVAIVESVNPDQTITAIGGNEGPGKGGVGAGGIVQRSRYKLSDANIAGFVSPIPSPWPAQAATPNQPSSVGSGPNINPTYR